MLKKSFIFALAMLTFIAMPFFGHAQVNEPEFIGDAFILGADNQCIPLDKALASYTQGMSFKSNSWNALSLVVNGAKANTRIQSGQTITIIVKADNNSYDPLSCVTIYRLASKSKKRSVLIASEGDGVITKSKTHSKDLLYFNGKKYGSSSYLIQLNNVEPGEYGILLHNPNNRDERRAVVACFGVDM